MNTSYNSRAPSREHPRQFWNEFKTLPPEFERIKQNLLNRPITPRKETK